MHTLLYSVNIRKYKYKILSTNTIWIIIRQEFSDHKITIIES